MKFKIKTTSLISLCIAIIPCGIFLFLYFNGLNFGMPQLLSDSQTLNQITSFTTILLIIANGTLVIAGILIIYLITNFFVKLAKKGINSKKKDIRIVLLFLVVPVIIFCIFVSIIIIQFFNYRDRLEERKTYNSSLKTLLSNCSPITPNINSQNAVKTSVTDQEQNVTGQEIYKYTLELIKEKEKIQQCNDDLEKTIFDKTTDKESYSYIKSQLTSLRDNINTYINLFRKVSEIYAYVYKLLPYESNILDKVSNLGSSDDLNKYTELVDATDKFYNKVQKIYVPDSFSDLNNSLTNNLKMTTEYGHKVIDLRKQIDAFNSNPYNYSSDQVNDINNQVDSLKNAPEWKFDEDAFLKSFLEKLEVEKIQHTDDQFANTYMNILNFSNSEDIN